MITKKHWKPFFFWAVGLILSIHGVLASDSGKWERLLIRPGYLGNGLTDYPELSPLEQVMIDSLGQLPHLTKPIMVIQEKGKYYCFIRCFLGLYQWNGEEWRLFSSDKVTGYNCYPYEFFYEEKIYQISGQGYWQSKSDLFEFKESQLVDFIKTNNH